MLARIMDRIEDRLAPHAKAISIAAAIWFWTGVALQARFVPLPELPRPVEIAIFWAGVAFNAVWWGFLRPAIEARKTERQAPAEPGAP